jgi:hypothetical protein
MGYDPSLFEEYLSKSLHGDWREKGIFVEQLTLLDLQVVVSPFIPTSPFSGEYIIVYLLGS